MTTETNNSGSTNDSTGVPASDSAEAKELQQLRADVTRLSSELDSVRNEAAKHRIARNDALRREAALGVVLKAHNVQFDVASADLTGYAIQDGKAVGEFEYSPIAPPIGPVNGVQPRPTLPDMSGKGGANDGITMDSISKMTPAQINAQWDDIQKVLSANQKPFMRPGG